MLFRSYDSAPSFAEGMQVTVGDRSRESLPRSVHHGPDIRYQEYAGTIRRFQAGEIGGCQTCHEINYEWGRTTELWGSALPRGDPFATPFFNDSTLGSPMLGGGPTSAAELRALRAWVDGSTTGSTTATAAAAAAPTVDAISGAGAGVPSAAAALPTVDAISGADAAVPDADAAAPANPWVPGMPLPAGVEVPAPRTDLCGELPDAADAERQPNLASWGPGSAIVADVVRRIDAVLTPLGPRGYRVLGRTHFQSLYNMTPEGMEGVRDGIVGRIGQRQTDYRNLGAEIDSGAVPYEELCPVVDELLPSTNQSVRGLAIADVHKWQWRETILNTLELVLLAVSIMFPPAALFTVPAGVMLGLVRVSLGMDQRRQGRQWMQGRGAGVYSMSQEAQAPDLVSRGNSNIGFGLLSVLPAGIGLARRGIGLIQTMREMAATARMLRLLDEGAVITHAAFPGVRLLSNRGALLLVTDSGEILGAGVIRNGRISWSPIRVPAAPASSAPSWAGNVIDVGDGTGTAIVPYGFSGGSGGSSALVPFGGGGRSIAPWADPAAGGGSGGSMLMLPWGARPLLMLPPGRYRVPSSWVSSPEFNALLPHELPPVGGVASDSRWVRLADGSWAVEMPPGVGEGTILLTYGNNGQASFLIDVPEVSRTAVVTPRTGATYQGGRSYPMDPIDMADPVSGTTGARSHLIPHADTPAGPVVATAEAPNYLDHLSHVYNKNIRRTLEQRMRAAGNRWFAYNTMYSPPRYSTGGFAIPEAEVIIEVGPNGPIRGWRFPNDPALYQSLPADFDTALAPFQLPSTAIPATPVQ